MVLVTFVTIVSNNIGTDIHCDSLVLLQWLQFSLFNLGCSYWIVVVHSAPHKRDTQTSALKICWQALSKNEQERFTWYGLVLRITVEAADYFWKSVHSLARERWRSLSSDLYFSCFILALSHTGNPKYWSEGNEIYCYNKVFCSHALPRKLCKKLDIFVSRLCACL